MFKIVIFFVLLTNTAYAYIGPGLGGGFIAAIFGLIFAIFGLLFGLVWIPLKRFYKKR